MSDGMTRRAALGAVGTAGLAALTVTLLAPPKALAAEKEKHPKIRKALDDLHDAKEELDKAATDFGGHKKAAQEAVQAAIDQLEICLKND
jgi:hypothetical protein